MEEEQRRQMLLESQNKTVNNQPLTFGVLDDQPMDSKQMRHILELRSLNRIEQKSTEIARPTSAKNARAAFAEMIQDPAQQGSQGDAHPPLVSSVLASALGVDRLRCYDALTEEGAEMHQEQLRELAEILGDSGEEDCSDEDDASTIGGTPAAAKLGEISFGTRKTLSGTRQGWASQDKEDVFTSSEKASGRRGTVKRGTRVRLSKSMHSKLSINSESIEIQSKAAKDMVLARVNAPLPQELCQRKVSTSWVSPALTRICGDDGDRNVMRKSSSEARELGMQIPSSSSRPASAPRISKGWTQSGRSTGLSQRPLSQQGSRCHGLAQSGRSADSTQRPSSQQGPRRSISIAKDETTSTMASVGSTSRTVTGNLTIPDASHSSTAASHRKPNIARVPSAGHGHDRTAETITLEVKPISMKTTMQRLEQMSQQFRKQAFGEYMKEYDIFTGDKKTRLNGKRLKDEEEAYVREMNKIVGGRGLRVDPFSKSQKRRMAQVAAASGPPKVSEAQQASRLADSGLFVSGSIASF